MADLNDLPPPEKFSPSLMNETWDLSNSKYLELLDKQRKLEEERAQDKAKSKRERGVWERIKDALVPA
jgi:hypothetical protein